MKGKISGLDSKRFDKLLSEFAEALDVPVSDFVEYSNSDQEYYWRKDYWYADNQILPLFLIELYEKSVRLVIDTASGSKVYEWHDEETLEALNPLILKTLKKSLESLKNQIVYQASEKEMSIIVCPSSLDKKEVLMYFRYKGETCPASAKGGKIELATHILPPDVCVEYMHAVEKYLVPLAKGAKNA